MYISITFWTGYKFTVGYLGVDIFVVFIASILIFFAFMSIG